MSSCKCSDMKKAGTENEWKLVVRGGIVRLWREHVSIKKPEAVWSRHFRWDTNKVSHNEDKMVVKDLMWYWRSWQRRAAFMLPGKIQWSWIRIVRNHHFSSLCFFFLLVWHFTRYYAFRSLAVRIEKYIIERGQSGPSLGFVRLYTSTSALSLKLFLHNTTGQALDLMVALPSKVYTSFVRDLAKEFIFAEKKWL